MSESKAVFCVEWGFSPIAHEGSCFRRLETFDSAYDARDLFDAIDLKALFERAVEVYSIHATNIIANKFCYVAERKFYEQMVPTAFLDRAYYGYIDFAIDSIK